MGNQERTRPIVMIVDDNPAIRDMISLALDLGGYEAVECRNGQEALDWIAQGVHVGRYPSVILLDLNMPEMDGYTFLKQFHVQWAENRPFPPVVVITATAAGKMQDAAPLGVKHVVIKPFRVRDLLDIVGKLID